MNNKFDELAKVLAQSVTRRAALKRFGFGLASAVLALLGLPLAAHAGVLPPGSDCSRNKDCASGVCKCTRYKVPCTTHDICGHITICKCL